VKIDDPRFDPMWDACGQLNMPVAIHVSDPLAFFTLTDRFNERYEE
jgi:predicted TIM-barrel fold metal-dependent hydrolase